MRTFGTFDYIVVGAGSAGCVLANRLSASGDHRVLLLEAGGEDRNPWIHIPIGYAKLFRNRKVNWLYESEPEPALNHRRIVQPRGKVLGGSSSINGLVYIRGQKEDFDHWRQLGNVGWSYDDVLPHFRRAEDQQRGGDEFHVIGGLFCVSDQCEPHEFCDAVIAAAEQAGIPRNDDFNGARQEGAGYFQTTSRRGLRCSAAVGYLRPARKRANLSVLTQAATQRVLFAGNGPWASHSIIGARLGRPAPRARSFLPPAPSPHRRCCSFPAWGRQSCCGASPCRSSWTCRCRGEFAGPSAIAPSLSLRPADHPQ
jgi:choline dehydrogenase